MTNAFNEKPCTVSTAQGFSILYKERLLYSKYNPKKSILQTIQSLQILPKTLILCNSPALEYGLLELINKLPENCVIVLCEANHDLYNFEKESLKQFIEDNSLKDKLVFLSPEKLLQLPSSIENDDFLKNNDIVKIHFRKVLRLDFSAGVQFSPSVYDSIFLQCQTVISQFWKNRLTLVRFGRLYSRNLFQNLARATQKRSSILNNKKNTISKPILICGTGESLEQTIKTIHKENILEKFYILAVDASIPVLLANNIIPDGVVAVESQLAIEKNYIGTLNKSFTFFADITSRPHVVDLTSNEVCFFSSEYDKNSFLEKIEKDEILPTLIPPLGSVGLTAVQVALVLRACEAVPIFVTGLDFSYSVGKTHANGSNAQKEKLISCNRLTGIENYNAAFSNSSVIVSGKNGKTCITTPSLSGYAKTFSAWFSSVKNLFDIGQSGLSLEIQKLENWTEICSQIEQIPEQEKKIEPFNKENYVSKISCFLENEEKSLLELKNLLQNGNSLFSQNELQSRIENLIKDRNYLYLHFPDGFDFSLELSFLKRVRSEIDFFLKDIKMAKHLINL